jgi:hypothetical protein
MSATDVGDVTRLTIAFANAAGAAVDPTTVSFQMREPGAKVTTYTYPTDSQLVKDGVGSYHVDWQIGLAGSHAYRWLGAGANAASEFGGFIGTPNPITAPAQLVSLADVKDYLNLASTNTIHDAKLTRFIDSVRPLVENLTGPILPATFDEWYDGGRPSLQLRHRPATGYGTSPVINLMQAQEFYGNTAYTLALVADPSKATTYSLMVDRAGEATRLGAGGASVPFSPGKNTVHLVYQSGQASVPANVYEGTLELIRVNYQTTQQVGRGRLAVSDEGEMTGPAMGYFVPRRVRELLQPNRRRPAIA